MRLESQRYELPSGESSGWFAATLGELRQQHHGSLLTRLYFRGARGTHTAAGELLLSSRPDEVAIQEQGKASPRVVATTDFVGFKLLGSEDLPRKRGGRLH